MHSKLYIVRCSFEDISEEDLKDQVVATIDTYQYDSGEIDYFQTMEDLAGKVSGIDHEPDPLGGEELRKKFITGLVERMCAEYFAYKMDHNKIKFTKRSMEKYFSKKIDETIKFVKKFKKKEYSKSFWDRIKTFFGYKPKYTWQYDVTGFVKGIYTLHYNILDEDDPKFYTEYAGMEGESEFIRTIYRKMQFNGLEEIEVEIFDIWDYHF